RWSRLSTRARSPRSTPRHGRSLGCWRPAGEQRVTIAVRDALGQRGWKIGEPRPRPVGVLDDVVPALRGEGVGADHEPVGKFGEDLAPLGGHLAVGSLIAAIGEVAPQVLVSAQHVANLFGTFESRMCPEYSRLRILHEQPLDRVLVGVRVEYQTVLLG